MLKNQEITGTDGHLLTMCYLCILNKTGDYTYVEESNYTHFIFCSAERRFSGLRRLYYKRRDRHLLWERQITTPGSAGHTIPGFSFTDQDGQTKAKADVEGKIYVAEFFFTTCTGICPKMNANMDKVYAKYKDKPDFLILSHTVDPEHDSVPVLKAYAAKHHADSKNWWFVTGDKKQLYRMARQGYLVDDGVYTGEEDFVHTQWFALVDKTGHVRGLYEGTKQQDVSRLIEDIDRLMEE